MKEKVIIFSKKDGFFNNEGFFIFDKPFIKIRYKSNILTINNKKIKTKNPLPIVEKLVKKSKGYAVGFFSYDLKELILGKKKLGRDLIDMPLIYINIYRKYTYKDKAFIPEDVGNVYSISYPDKNKFLDIVKKAKKYIESGDIYQVNLSHRIEISGSFYTENIFFKIANYQPTPFLMYIKDKSFSLISASMELFLKKEKDKLVTKPIKGTRPRGKTKEEDKKLQEELFKSEKEKAENLMITDLMRNDLGRISRKKSVKVERLFEIEKYETLFQMSSTITSILKKNTSLKDIIYNTFPPGSVTGAPKIRAMEIIDELEEYKRHVYCGATFLIKPDFDFTMSVAIRQSIFQKDRCFVYIGAGIVYDSDPQKEYEETILKAKANIKPLTD